MGKLSGNCPTLRSGILRGCAGGPGEATNSSTSRRAEDEGLLDGKYVLRANSSLDPEEVSYVYKSLWQVERAFRELKSGLDLRPVHHWTERRIRGHVMICFLALVLEMALRRKLAALGENVPYDDLLSDLSELRAVELHLDGRRCLARTDLVGQADLVFRAVGLRPPSHITEMPPVGH